MATEYVIRNTQNRPDRSGVVRPFLTRMFDGRTRSWSRMRNLKESSRYSSQSQTGLRPYLSAQRTHTIFSGR
jgi:hypothetical protein